MEHLTLSQKISLQKKLVQILNKKYLKNPTEANKNDLQNEIRILKQYEPEIDVRQFLETNEFS